MYFALAKTKKIKITRNKVRAKMKTLEAKPFDQNAENWKRENGLFTSTMLEAGVPAKMSTRENVHLTIPRQRILIRRQNSPVKRSRENVHQPRIWTPNSLNFAHAVHFAHGDQNLLLSFDCSSLTDSEGFAHFQIRICLGTKPASCSLVFLILFSLRMFAFPKKGHNLTSYTSLVFIKFTITNHKPIAEIPSIRTSQVLPGKSLKFNKTKQKAHDFAVWYRSSC